MFPETVAETLSDAVIEQSRKPGVLCRAGVIPSVITKENGEPVAKIHDGDSVIFYILEIRRF